MNINAIQRVEDDKRRAEQRRRLASVEAEKLAQAREQKEAKQAARAKAGKVEYEFPFQEQVAARLAELNKTTKGDNTK